MDFEPSVHQYVILESSCATLVCQIVALRILYFITIIFFQESMVLGA